MTSALAARRAALAAQAKIQQEASIAPSAAPVAVSPSPASPTPSLSDLDSDDGAGPSKRRKISKKTARYFAPASDDDDDVVVKKVKKRSRKFSPSAPASEADDGMNMDDSSDEEVSSVGEEVDEGRAVWTVNSTPAPTRPGVSIKTSSPGSKFKPVMGANVHLVSEVVLNGCGIEGTGAGVVVSLGKQESLMLAGVYTILPLQSPINILSTTLYPSTTQAPIPVFGPSSHPTPVISPSMSKKRGSPSKSLSHLSLPSTFQNGETRTIFLIREYECGLQGLRNGAVPGFSNIWGEDKGLWGLRSVHPIFGNNSTIHHPHVQPDSWTEPLASLIASESTDDSDVEDEDSAPIALVKGPKRSGKSTFGRAVLNNLLNRYEKVAWLECDLGQGEFSPGGVVGLWLIDRPVLGPPFTHPRAPEKAHYLGSFTPQTCPDEYITAIQNLIQHYTYEIAHPLLFPNTGKIGNTIPLVVNTQGWVKGLGEELLRSIEIATSPSHLFTFESDQDEPAIQHNGNGGGWTSSPPPEFPNTYTHLNRPPIVHTLQSAPITPLLARHTPSDLRTLAMIAYFHSQLSTTTTTTWDFSTPLLAVAPYQVDLSPTGSLRKVYTSGEGSENIIPEDLALALNGNIIALIHETDQDPAIEDIYDPTQSPGLDETTFLGLALVRAIKFTEDGYILHLLTPVTGECLQRANAIIRNGAVELPLCGMLDWRAPNAPDLAGVKWEDTPYLDVSGVVGVGGERRRFRRNLMRKGM